MPDISRSGAGDYETSHQVNGDFLSAIMRMAMISIRENLHLRMLCAAAKVWQHMRRELMQSLSDPYRPERHYMRGPGPRYRAKALNVTSRRPGLR
jgi:hypothetical protein